MVFREAIKNSIFHEISNYCSANNIDSFVVGGFVRDFFLKRPSKDIDILIIGDGINVAKQIAKQIFRHPTRVQSNDPVVHEAP